MKDVLLKPKPPRARTARIRARAQSLVNSCEILILPNGQILAHNLSAGLARVLAKLNPADTAMKRRARAKKFEK